MNAPLRRVGVVVLVLFAMLFVNLNYRQVVKADDYRENSRNGRVQASEYERARGKIVNAQGIAVADAQETGDSLKFLRTYPLKDQYAHVLGYKPVNLAATSLEKLNNDFLVGTSDKQAADRIAGLFTGEKPAGGNVLLTISKSAQETAYTQLGNNKLKVKSGAVVALDPSTGAVLAEVSLPSYDPNLLSTHDTNAALANYKKLDADPGKPLLNRAVSDIYPPGSTFKVITSAAALTADSSLSPDSMVPGGEFYQPPQTSSFRIKNAHEGICPDSISLKQALTVSCNTVFARMGVERIGADKLKRMAADFGFESEPKYIEDQDRNYCGIVASHTGSMTAQNGVVDPPAVAQSSIGQREVKMSPLQGAMIAATVANGGREMRPYVVDRLQNADLSNADRTEPKEMGRPISGDVAAKLQEMMFSVVTSRDGTGRSANVSGLQVGGKTGTAEDGEDAQDHGWFIGFALKDGKPIISVAVFLENAGKGGSAEAARIAGQVMKAYADEKGIK
ncbi:penicillin-binding transpeptidase domain-containing protein [Dactylosporangium sp. AC04546]|uniref:peptidoglycan D,D-transpeptidase FtsI family protein n=1 Tax=Dactylosporangium sp. AC04546 TaxID=2862460 RepID=UPI001EDD2F95|nr:penicillin-binding transpeptidase domain-containing protein [Dactylosporangium sp. AC04546]WVK83929.1 penicillin-binding transpeptidase domain-containing protein [Dactylosporangium sp. AC04546]